jgi:NAD(P)-dependent dehydrogenase (short-subunit alcohol dehydrogenase family)
VGRAVAADELRKGRAGSPHEIASMTIYLASGRNGYVTDATVNVDGGSDFILGRLGMTTLVSPGI